MKPTSAQLRALAKRDPVLGRAIRQVERFPGFPQPGGYRSHYHALARSILYQQLAGAAASTIYGRVCDLTPGAGFPRAAELLALPEKKLRAAGLSANKLLALRDLARHTESGELCFPSISRLSDERIIERLVQVRGIGEWTVQMFLIFRLGRLDVMPTGDLGVQEGMRILDGLRSRPKPKELGARAEVWRPLRSVATWTLYRLTDTAAPS
jgi:3-methyladenine DNA glycosylase/8-oxoguanine DNA glycosylase